MAQCGPHFVCWARHRALRLSHGESHALAAAAALPSRFSDCSANDMFARAMPRARTSLLRCLGVMPVQVGQGQERVCKGQFGGEPFKRLKFEEALDKVQGQLPLGWHWGQARVALLFTQVSAPEAGKLSCTKELLIMRILRMRVKLLLTLCMLPKKRLSIVIPKEYMSLCKHSVLSKRPARLVPP